MLFTYKKIKKKFIYYGKPIYIFLYQEFHASVAKKKLWDHALHLTQKLFIRILWPAFKATVIYVWWLASDIIRFSFLTTIVLNFMEIFFLILRRTYMSIMWMYIKFTERDEEYRTSLYYCIALWSIMGLILWWVVCL